MATSWKCSKFPLFFTTSHNSNWIHRSLQHINQSWTMPTTRTSKWKFAIKVFSWKDFPYCFQDFSLCHLKYATISLLVSELNSISVQHHQMMQRQHNRDSLNAWARKHALLFMHYNYSMMHLAVCTRIGYISGIKFPQQPQTRGCNILKILIVTYLYLIFVGYFMRFILPLSHGLVVPFNSCPLSLQNLWSMPAFSNESLSLFRLQENFIYDYHLVLYYSKQKIKIVIYFKISRFLSIFLLFKLNNLSCNKSIYHSRVGFICSSQFFSHPFQHQ